MKDCAMHLGNVCCGQYRPVPPVSRWFRWTESRRPPRRLLRMCAAFAALAAAAAFWVAATVCADDVGWGRSFVAVLCGTFGRFVMIGRCKWGITPSDIICVSMVVCSSICFWGRRGHKSEGCISVLFVCAWGFWLIVLGLGYFAYWK